MEKQTWIVVLEKLDGNDRELYRVEAVGYEQAITFAKDKLVAELAGAAPTHIETEWRVVRVDSLLVEQ